MDHRLSEQPAHGTLADFRSVAVPSLNSLLASISAGSLPLSLSSPQTTGFGVSALSPVPIHFATAAWVPQPPAFPLFISQPQPPQLDMADTAASTEEESPASTEASSGNRRRSERLSKKAAKQKTKVSEPASPDTSEISRKREAEDLERPKKRVRKSSKKAPPNAKDDAKYDETEEVTETTSELFLCCICMSEPEHHELSIINGCEHRFCFDCISKWADRENSCPLCKVRFSKISRVHKMKKKRGEKSPSNTKQVRARDQRSDLVSGAALEAMLNSIAASNRAAIRGTPSRIGRVLFAMGAPMAGRQSRPTSRRAALFVEDNLIESDEDSSEGFAMPDFNELMRQTMNMARRDSRRSPFAASIGSIGAGFHPGTAAAPWLSAGAPLYHGLYAHHHPPPPPQSTVPQRSYAVNMNDSDAGRAAENPLEIDDSSEDEVEFIGSSAP